VEAEESFCRRSILFEDVMDCVRHDARELYRQELLCREDVQRHMYESRCEVTKEWEAAKLRSRIRHAHAAEAAQWELSETAVRNGIVLVEGPWEFGLLQWQAVQEKQLVRAVLVRLRAERDAVAADEATHRLHEEGREWSLWQALWGRMTANAARIQHEKRERFNVLEQSLWQRQVLLDEESRARAAIVARFRAARESLQRELDQRCRAAVLAEESDKRQAIAADEDAAWRGPLCEYFDTEAARLHKNREQLLARTAIERAQRQVIRVAEQKARAALVKAYEIAGAVIRTELRRASSTRSSSFRMYSSIDDLPYGEPPYNIE
jgi:hypothetical protein